MSEPKPPHELTLKLSAAKMVSLRRAVAAVESILGETFTDDGFTVTLKVKSWANLDDEADTIKQLFRGHKGVSATVTTKTTAADIEGGHDDPAWDQMALRETLN